MAAGGRHGARRLLLQALYQWQLTHHDVDALEAQFVARPEYEGIDGEYFSALLREVIEDVASLDESLAAVGDRPVEQLDPVERAILWGALAEFMHHDDVPPKVIINEAVRLAKQFGAEDGHRYVNAVLDKASRQLRPTSSQG